MAMQYKTILYGGKAGIDVGKADISAIATEAGQYLKDNGMQAQGIKLPGLEEAKKLVTAAIAVLKKASASSNVKELGFTPALKVIGGIDAKGNLSATITGMLPPPKPGKPPVNYDETAIIRKDWAGLEQELKADTNVVVNLTKDMAKVEELIEKLGEKHNGDLKAMKADKAFVALIVKYRDGDDVINKAADRQAKKFKTTELSKDEADFGEITKGTVILAAHGTPEKVGGAITIGIKLGKMTPTEIVALLTEQKDKSRNLSKDFTGNVLLSGCFTAAGGIAPVGDKYDYSTFAEKVWTLLKAKGIKCKVSGLPGQARTDEKGNKSAVKPTEQDEYNRLKKEFQTLEAAIEKLGPKLKSKDPKVLAVVNKQIKDMNAKLKTVGAEKESKVMKELIMNYGLDPVR